MRALILALAGLAVAAGGCHASASASVKTGKTEEPSFDEADKAPPPQGEATAEPPTQDYALLGARHDLRLAPDKKTPVCSCLAVALGAPTDPSFAWEGAPPAIDPDNQLVVAVSSDGIACPKAKPNSLGASYWGYRVNGNDVFVIVENAHLGRPITAGAVIPKPGPGGQVYVRPGGKDVPYGRPLVSGDKLCKLGSPGGARTAPPAKPENGEPEDFEE